MELLDQIGGAAKNIGAAAGDLAKQVVEKASDALEISRLNSKISADKAEIEKEMKKISEALYDKFSKGGEIPEEIKEFCDNIKARYLNIDKLKEEIERVKTTVGEKVEEAKEVVQEKAEEVKDKAEDVKEAAKDKVEDVKETAKDVKEEVVEKATEVKEAAKDKAEDVKDAVVEGAEKAQEAVEDALK